MAKLDIAATMTDQAKHDLAALAQRLASQGELYLRVKVRANATTNYWRQLQADGTLKLDIAAAPTKGKANLVLRQYLAELFAIPVSHVKLVAGAGEVIKLLKLNK